LMNFSLIIPTRNRTQLLKELLDSLVKNTKYKDKIEVLALGQNDDPTVFESLPRFKEEYGEINFEYWIFPWTKKYCVEYRKFLCSQAKGKYICSSEDEHEYMTKDWDKLLFDKFEEFLKPDGILYGRVKDNNHNDGYSCCPIVSRKTVELLDYEIYDMRFYGWSADQNLYALFSGMENQRICLVPEVYIKHKSHHHNARQKDETNQLVCDLNSEYPLGVMDDKETDRRRKILDNFINTRE